MLKVISANLNGIRAAARKGFFDWLAQQNADVVCLQETKAHMLTLTDPMFYPKGYYHYFFDAVKPGYSGVGIYTKIEPQNVQKGLGFALADTEGRYIQVDFEGLSVASLYLPSGSSGDHRQALKYEFMHEYFKILHQQKKQSREFIICGDYNIVHKEIDIKNWKANQQSSGCLPEERAWLDKIFGPEDYVDAFRVVNQEPDQYTWWTYRAGAWHNNVGWRIDYQVITPGLKDKVRGASIARETRFSDHAPLTIDYDLCLALP